MSYLVLRGCDWPASLDVRERIRAGERIEPDDRGDLERYESGDVCDPPADVLPALLGMDGVLEAVKPPPPPPPPPDRPLGTPAPPPPAPDRPLPKDETG